MSLQLPDPKIPAHRVVPAPRVDLNDMLLDLNMYGNATVLRMSNSGKWWAFIEMHVASTGAKFQVESESAVHDTPVAAVQQLTERIEAALAKWR